MLDLSLPRIPFLRLLDPLMKAGSGKGRRRRREEGVRERERERQRGLKWHLVIGGGPLHRSAAIAQRRGDRRNDFKHSGEAKNSLTTLNFDNM